MKAIRWLKARLREQTTWLGISTAIGGCYAFAVPFNWLAIAAGVIAVLVKDPEK